MDAEESAHAVHESIEQDVLLASTTHDIDQQSHDHPNEPDSEMRDANADEESDEDSDGEDAEPVAKHLPGQKASVGKKEAVGHNVETPITSAADRGKYRSGPVRSPDVIGSAMKKIATRSIQDVGRLRII